MCRRSIRSLQPRNCCAWRAAGAGKHAASSGAAQRTSEEASIGARQAAGGQPAAAAPDTFAPLTARGYEPLSKSSAVSGIRPEGASQSLARDYILSDGTEDPLHSFCPCFCNLHPQNCKNIYLSQAWCKPRSPCRSAPRAGGTRSCNSAPTTPAAAVSRVRASSSTGCVSATLVLDLNPSRDAMLGLHYLHTVYIAGSLLIPFRTLASAAVNWRAGFTALHRCLPRTLRSRCSQGVVGYDADLPMPHNTAPFCRAPKLTPLDVEPSCAFLRSWLPSRRRCVWASRRGQGRPGRPRQLGRSRQRRCVPALSCQGQISRI